MDSINLDSIGGFVYTEENGMCSWVGETIALWAKFDTDPPKKVAIGLLRKHLIAALPRVDDVRPDVGYIKAKAFKIM